MRPAGGAGAAGEGGTGPSGGGGLWPGAGAAALGLGC